MAHTAASIQDLLIHADFLRRVARDLAADAAGADDLVQSVWLRAMQRSPRHAGSLRGWLVRTAQNLLRNERRGQQRRARRERALARPAATAPSAAEILAREQTREVVVRAVLALEEPFREALLLRYYEDLSPREIAARTGVPVATVRSRTARGLERLRARLDAEHGGARHAWLPAVLQWVRPAAALPAGIAMKKLALAVVALVLVALSVGALGGFGDEPAGAGRGRGGEPAAALRPAADPAATALQTEDAAPLLREPAPTGATPSRAPLVYPAERGRGTVHGDVVGADGAPRPGVAVHAAPHLGHLPPVHPIADDRSERWRTVTDARGRFVIEDVAEGPTLVTAEAGGERATAVTAASASDPRGPLRLTLQPRTTQGDDVRILVAGGDQRPVAGASVEIHGWSPGRPSASGQPLFTGSTDEQGEVAALGLALGAGVVTARTADGRAGMAPMRIDDPDPQRVTVTLTAAGGVHGRLRAAVPAALDGAVVSLHGASTTSPYWTSAGITIGLPVRDGTFLAEGLAPGTYVVALDAAGGGRLVLEGLRWGADVMPNSVAPALVEVRPGEIAEWEAEVVPGGRIEGTVTGGGKPVAGARVRSVLAPHTSNYPAGVVLHGAHVWRLDGPHEGAPTLPVAQTTAVTDADGTYVLRGLPPGRHRLEVAAAGFAFDRRMDIEVRDGEVLRQVHELPAAGVLQVATLGVSYLGVIPSGGSAPQVIAIIRNDCATFPALAAGRYTVARFHSDPRVQPVPLGEATVIAGRTTWLDLRRACVQAVLTGRVMAGSEPVAGAAVTLFPTTVITDAQGAFRLELGFPVYFSRPGSGAVLQIRAGSFEYGYVPAVPDPVRAADFEVQLGTRRVEIHALDGNGVRVPARFELRAAGPDGETGLHRVEGSVALPAVGSAAVGPVPPWRIEGAVVFADGLRAPVVLAADAAGPIVVPRPATAMLRVRLRLAGSPVTAHPVYVATFVGDGPAPVEDYAFVDHAVWQEGRTDEHGIAAVAVRPGELLVHVSHGRVSRHRVRVPAPLAAGEERTVEVELPVR